jgi:hypothetical protein
VRQRPWFDRPIFLLARVDESAEIDTWEDSEAWLMPRPATLRSVDDLRRYVRHTLCQHENLVPEQFQLGETSLSRGGEPCGLQFVLNGPRNVRLGAVWAADHNQLYFYDARGERFHKEQLNVRLVTGH